MEILRCCTTLTTSPMEQGRIDQASQRLVRCVRARRKSKRELAIAGRRLRGAVERGL